MSATHNPQVSVGQAPPADYAVQVEKITAPARIKTVLKRLLQARSLLTVSLSQVSDSYNSILLSLGPDDGSMMLDELTPAAGHTHLLRVRTLHIQAQLRGVEISFSSDLIEAGAKDGMALYRVSLPSVLNYAQRRANYRAHVGMATVVPVTFTTQAGLKIGGHLCDISAGGLCARFAPQAVKLAQGELIYNCVMRLTSGEEVACAIEVRFVNTDAHAGQWLVGGRFIKMERVQQHRVERFVAALDREMRKKENIVK